MNDRQPSPKILRDILYTRDEVARLAKVCTRTVARDVRAGRLEEIRYNRRRIRYRRGAVEAYLATPPQPAESMFDHLYAELPPELAAQRAALSERGTGTGS